jgi:hypothetical protein
MNLYVNRRYPIELQNTYISYAVLSFAVTFVEKLLFTSIIIFKLESLITLCTIARLRQDITPFLHTLPACSCIVFSGT